MEAFQAVRGSALAVLDWLQGTHISVLHFALALIFGGTGFLLYWRSLSRSLAKELDIKVKRTISKEKAPVRKPGKVHAAMADHVSKNPFMAALELDQEACKAGPFADVPMCSLADYYRSLDVGPGGISAEKVAATLLAKAGMQALLPAVDAFAPEATKQGYNADDILANGFMGALFRKLLSPLKIFAITSALNEASSDMSAADLGHLAAAAQPSPVAAVDHFLAGEQPGLEPIWPEEFNLEDSFVLERDLPLIMAAWGVSRDDQSPTSKPEPGSEFLPDLCFSYGGLKTQETPWQNATGRILSRLLNRLGANAMQATMKTGKKPFTVCLTGSQASAAQMAGFTKPEELITALHEAKHTVDMGIVTRPTSFGFGLSIKEGTTYTNIPLLLPLDSGLQLLASSDTQDQDHDKILVPACHGGVFLSVSGPLVDCKVEWYQGIEGFTGWHNGDDWVKVWANDPEVEVRHDNPRWTRPVHWRAAFETSTVASIALNITAARSKLPNGGYGYLGICMDSAAAIQQALTGQVTLFPLVLCGKVKSRVMLLYKELEADLAAAGRPELASAAAALRLAMSQLPTDIIHQPQDTADICERVMAVLPKQSPFAMIADNRKKVLKLREQAAALTSDDKKLGKEFASTRTKSFKSREIDKFFPPWM